MDDFGEFYAARKDPVLRALLVTVGDRATAEDAAAEAFARAYARWSRVRGHPNPTAWVLRTALNAQRSWWRRRRREIPGGPAHDPPVSAGAPPGLDPDLRTAVAGLPARQRQVIALRLLADLSAEETGELLGISPATVHVHLHRALVTLRQRLGADRPAEVES